MNNIHPYLFLFLVNNIILVISYYRSSIRCVEIYILIHKYKNIIYY